jgi:hypothetical protein
MFRRRFGGLPDDTRTGPVRRRGRVRWLPVLLFLGYLGYYFLSKQEEVPLTGRKQLIDISREQEMDWATSPIVRF